MLKGINVWVCVSVLPRLGSIYVCVGGTYRYPYPVHDCGKLAKMFCQRIEINFHNKLIKNTKSLHGRGFRNEIEMEGNKDIC